jgi:hypothetical protein
VDVEAAVLIMVEQEQVRKVIMVEQEQWVMEV